MAIRNVYLAYKRDERYVLYWLIDAWNTIVRNSNESNSALKPNTTCQTTVAGISSMCDLIAAQSRPVPDIVYSLFRSAISGRRSVMQEFQALAAMNSDPEVKKSNESHLVFVEALEKAFEVLGGKTWESTLGKGKVTAPTNNEDDDEIRLELIANKFSVLSVQNVANEGEDPAEDPAEGQAEESAAEDTAISAQAQKRQTKKGKGGKKGKKKGKPKASPKAEEQPPDIPWESYRIIEDAQSTGEDHQGIVTDFLLACYGLVQEWADLRSHVQSLWREVAYDGVNAAAAGAVSRIAVGMIKRTEAALFIDFPGHDSFETVMQTITRGDPDRFRENFSVELHRMPKDGFDWSRSQKVSTTFIDIREQFLIHTYDDLLAFLLDFQKNRSGKPTKAMAAQLVAWRPDTDLRRATDEERVSWRRLFTINWLYDLVNVFSSIVVQHNTIKGENHALEAVDWSPSGPWDAYRRLFGLNEFAGTVTTLAFQKPGGPKTEADLRRRIAPHLIFELQCIVDATCASRGWSVGVLRGHVVTAPPSGGFRARRDVDLFLDRENERIGRGLLQGLHILERVLHHSPEHTCRVTEPVLETLRYNFDNWLGKSKYMNGLDTIPPSRFTSTNANGLWEYSPYLCGVGLLEGLQVAFLAGVAVWDRMVEPMTLVHLHHMLVKKGYIGRPVGLFDTLQGLFARGFFGADRVEDVPELREDRFAEAYVGRMLAKRSNSPQQKAMGATLKHAKKLQDVLDVRLNTLFNADQSFMAVLRNANYDVERIPDQDLPVPGVYSALRCGMQCRQRMSSGGGRGGKKPTKEKSELAKKWARISPPGTSVEEFTQQLADDLCPRPAPIPEALRQAVAAEGFHMRESLKSGRHGFQTSMPTTSNGGGGGGASVDNNNSSPPSLSSRDLLIMLRVDIESDICGEGHSAHPLSSLNYFWVAISSRMLWNQIKDALKTQRNDLYVRVYERGETFRPKPADGGASTTGGGDHNNKMFQLAVRAMTEQQDECLRTMAKTFEDNRVGFTNHIYWDELGQRFSMENEMMKKAARQEEQGGSDLDSCCIM